MPQDPPYVPGTYKSLTAVDPSVLLARTGGPFTRNYGIIGVAQTCFSGESDCAGLGLACNRMPDVTLATNAPPTGKNLADMVIEREGGPRCAAECVLKPLAQPRQIDGRRSSIDVHRTGERSREQ